MSCWSTASILVVLDDLSMDEIWAIKATKDPFVMNLSHLLSHGREASRRPGGDESDTRPGSYVAGWVRTHHWRTYGGMTLSQCWIVAILDAMMIYDVVDGRKWLMNKSSGNLLQKKWENKYIVNYVPFTFLTSQSLYIVNDQQHVWNSQWNMSNWCNMLMIQFHCNPCCLVVHCFM